MLPSATDLGPVSSPEGPSAPARPAQGALLLQSDSLLHAPCSEYMVRITRRLGELRWRHLAGPPTQHEPSLYGGLAEWLRAHGWYSLETWAAAIALHARDGTPPARYAQDVIRRARGHARNAARGRPWVRQR